MNITVRILIVEDKENEREALCACCAWKATT